MTPVLTATSFDRLAGWHKADLSLSLQAFQRSAAEILSKASGFSRAPAYSGTLEDWLPTCKAAGKSADARKFFEKHFAAFTVHDDERPQGLFTGYYEPVVEGTRNAHPDFPVPVYRKPADLVAFTAEETKQTELAYGRRRKGKAEAYDTRQMIEQGSLAGQGLEVCWLKDWTDAFFMHIQGSGRVQLVEGGEIRLAYAGKTGQPYTGIGGVLLKRGVGTPETMSMQMLRQWMKDNPSEIRELMWNNKSYVFFQEIAVGDSSLGAIGAAKVNLTPLRSLAVDRRHWMFGTPIFLETTTPPETPGGAKPFVELMIAQDTGTAIKGLVRGDVYWGWGEERAFIAGHMKSPGKITVLLPNPVGRRLGLT
jgi:membrane-bound lytic murein transglycosylase A